MKIRAQILGIAICAATSLCAMSPASAAFLGSFDYTIDLSSAGLPKTGFLNAASTTSFSSFAPGVGDSFRINLGFVGNQALKYTDIDGDELERFSITMRTGGSTTIRPGFGYKSTTHFNNVAGTLLLNDIVSENTNTLFFGELFGISLASDFNLTDTMFSFSGASILVEITAAPPRFEQFRGFSSFGETLVIGGIETQRFELVAIAVSEPATLVLLGIGLTGFGFARRRRRSH